MLSGKILLVEDDESLGFVTKDSLEASGFQVTWSKNGTEGLEAFLAENFDLCLLDIMMPRMDGFSLATQIRQKNEFIPIIFLTARSMEEDKLKGFEIGGDDYVTKPFSIDELVHRIQVFLRRSSTQAVQSDKDKSVGKFRYNSKNLTLSCAGEVVSLTQMEGDLLEMLMDRRNALVKRSDILIRIWGEDDYFKGRSLDVFISRLRKYLKDDPTVTIRNHHGVGFTLSCPS